MRHALILATIGVTLMYASCSSVGQGIRQPDVKQRQVTAESLLAKVRNVLPDGWEARLYWSPQDRKLKSTLYSPDWLNKKWRGWLPGTDGRRIEIQRKEVVHFWEDAFGPEPDASYVRKREEYLRFALTLGTVLQAEEINHRLAELNSRITQLEIVLKPSFNHRKKDGFVRHSVPRNDEERRALREHDRLWVIKRWFPQWSEGNVSVGFRSLVGIKMTPEEAKVEYRQAKQTVLNVLQPIQGWEYIPSSQE